MICPVCGNNLTEMSVGDIVIDVCKNGCAGLWFDNFELQKVDEKHEHAGEVLLDIEKNKNVPVDFEAKRKCPKCDDIVMMRHFFSVKYKVAIDECAQCAGIWLDAGELADIRGLYETEGERKAAADKYFDGVIGSITAEASQKSEEDLARAKKFATMFKFICRSYYIPGDQTGGAF